MSKEKDLNRLALEAIADGAANSLRDAPDADVVEEACEVFGSVEAGAALFDSIIEKSKITANKKRMNLIKKEIDDHKKARASRNVVMSISEARKRIELALEHPDNSEKITMAARYGEGMPDEDVLGFYEDMIDLELLDEE